MMTTGPNDEELVRRGLSTLPRAEVPAGLGDRAFAAAMNAPAPSPWVSLFDELFAVARIGAGAAGVIAAVLLVVAMTRDSATTVAVTDASDEWVEAVLPLGTESE
jgi:hypothetical protein